VRRIGRSLLRIATTILVAATFVSLAVLAREFEVARVGTAAAYWESLCGVQLPGFPGDHPYSRPGFAYPTADGAAYYFAQLHHEQRLYSVPVADVLAAVPLVREHLVAPRAPSPSECLEPHGTLCEAYDRAAAKRSACVRWLDTADVAGAADLDALRGAVAGDAGFGAEMARDDAFRARLARGDRAWATFAFEAIYLAAWLLFVVGARPLRAGWRRRALLGPFLLFLPYFLGYAPMTFTFGPTGGFVYPMYLVFAALPMAVVPCSSLEGVVWPYFPQVLREISQVPGSPLAVSRFACVGPVSSLGFGVLLVALVSALRFAFARLRRGEHPA
jgi:hypothetical protein